MKLDSRMLVIVAMMVGAIGATGCKRSQSVQDEGAIAPAEEASPAAEASPAPAAPDNAAPATEDGTAVVRAPEPPALRVEAQTGRPSARHVWQNGYWRWTGREYTWSAGYWEEEGVTAPHPPPAVRYEDPGYAPSAAYFYAPGYWRWGGREYVWMGGHWSHNTHASYYYRPRWESSGGRWGYRVERWDRVPRTQWYHDRWDYRARGDFDRRGHAFDHRGRDVERRGEHRAEHRGEHRAEHRAEHRVEHTAPATRGTPATTRPATRPTTRPSHR